MAHAMKIVAMLFTVGAAKEFDYDEVSGREMPDWKVLDEASTIEEAMKKYHSIRDYPIREFHLETVWDNGDRFRVAIVNNAGEEKLVDGRWVPA